MMKTRTSKHHVAYKKTTLALSLLALGASAWGQNCPSNITSGASLVSCNSNADNKTIRSALPNLTLDGSNTPLTFSEPAYTTNGVLMNGGGNITLETKGQVKIAPKFRPRPSSFRPWEDHVPDGILIDRASNATLNLSKQTVIETNQFFMGSLWFFPLPFGADGIVINIRNTPGQTSKIEINSEASITTGADWSNGIIAKDADEVLMNIGGTITTKGDNSPAVNSSPLGRATNEINLKDATIDTGGRRSAGVVYNYSSGKTTAAQKNSTITATNSTISTKGEQAHAIAAGAGGSNSTKNTVNLKNSILNVSGADAHGVYLNTRRLNIGGKKAAIVNMTGGQITSSVDGIHFVDSASPIAGTLGGTHGDVTIAGDATINAARNAIFTGSGTDTVTLKDNVRIKGMVDGGDDSDSPDTWIDRLIFDNYNSTAQLAYANQLVQYKNFEYVKLQNNSHIQFTPNYSTPPSIGYEIDKSSTISKQPTGAQNTYTINANVTNNGTIDLQDGIVGDRLVIAGSGTPRSQGDFHNTGKLLIDTNFDSKQSDVIAVSGDVTGTGGTIEVKDVTPVTYSPYSDTPQGIAEARKAAIGEILIIDSPNDDPATAANFSLVIPQRYNADPQRGRFKKSPFVWELRRSGNNWVLGYDRDEGAPRDTQPVVLAEIPIYTSLPTIGRELSFAELDRLHTRLGELRNKASANTFSQDEEPKAGWLRAYAGAFDYSGKKGFALDGRYAGINLGFDRRIDHDNDWTTYAGIYGGYQTGRFRTTGKGSQINADTFGRARVHGWSLGAYATFFKETGTYVDLVGQYSRLNSNMHAAGLSTSTKGSTLAGSIEIGHSFTEEKDWVRKDWIIEPQAQLVFARGKWNDFNDGFNDVRVGSHTHVVGRLGVRAEKTIKKDNGESKPWLYAGIKHAFNRTPTVSYANTAFLSQAHGTVAELKLGWTRNINKPNKNAVQLYGDIGAASNFGNYWSVIGHLGLRFTWK